LLFGVNNQKIAPRSDYLRIDCDLFKNIIKQEDIVLLQEGVFLLIFIQI